MFYRQCLNPGKPTIVLLHGLAQPSSFAWCHSFQGLEAHYNVIAPDLPGHGRSDAPRSAFRLLDATDAVAQLIEELGLGSVIVAGYSLGGVIAQYLGALHPDKVAGLVLSGTGYGGRTNGMWRLARPLINLAVGAVGSGYAVHKLVKGPSRELPEDLEHNIFESVENWMRSEIAGHNYKAIAEASRELLVYDTREHLPYVEAPTSVLITTTDEAFSRVVQEEMAALIPRSSTSYYQGGHLSCLTGHFHQEFVEICAQMHPHAV